jgi:hypothetical protein
MGPDRWTLLLRFPSISFRFAIRLSASSIFFPAQGPIRPGGKKMKQAKRLILIAATVVAVLSVQSATFAKDASTSVSSTQTFNIDGTHPMPPYLA